MGLFDFLFRLFRRRPVEEPARSRPPATARAIRGPRPKARLVPLRRDATRDDRPRQPCLEVEGAAPPYRFARFGSRTGHYLDLSRDGDTEQLARRGLPVFHTPEELAAWAEVPLGTLAWLVHRFSGGRPENEKRSHYHYHWMPKRAGGWRLIESPKQVLKTVQRKILAELLDRVRPHQAAHGFVAGRSIVTNATPHVNSRVVVKLDLENFYGSVRFARVVALYRSLGYAREAAIWLALLTTSALPRNLPFPGGSATALLPFLSRHLPQGAPTSPALANLSAFSLDVRLSGLARSYGARYTRYADDLTFSGSQDVLRALPSLLPLIRQIVGSERFGLNARKCRVVRDSQRQAVTGVVVNEKVNVARSEFDRLKAILTNCARHGSASQNRDAVPDFATHLRGRIAHVGQLSAARAEKLFAIYDTIRWDG